MLNLNTIKLEKKTRFLRSLKLPKIMPLVENKMQNHYLFNLCLYNKIVIDNYSKHKK